MDKMRLCFIDCIQYSEFFGLPVHLSNLTFETSLIMSKVFEIEKYINRYCRQQSIREKSKTMTEKRIIKIIPSENSLIENIRKQCTVPDCTSTFTNLSNLQMHLEKHHGLPVNKIVDKMAEVHYYCPINKCKYNMLDESGSRFFKSKKYLRQHFLKVHAEKNIKCAKCIKTFANETLKVQHERCCGNIFRCLDCNWTYSSREGLLTHCRRKKHSIPPKTASETKRDLNKVASIRNLTDKKQNGQIQHLLAPTNNANDATIQSNVLMKKVQLTLRTPAARIKDNFERALQKGKRRDELRKTILTKCISKPSTIAAGPKPNEKYKSLDLIDEESNSSTGNLNEANQNLNSLSYIGDDSNLHYFTVSNFNAGLCHIETQTDLLPFDEANINSNEMDPLLCHMHTQTSDDILTELGLSNIQTQTNWEVCNDLFVSTETQTCFEAGLTMDNNSTQTQT